MRPAAQRVFVAVGCLTDDVSDVGRIAQFGPIEREPQVSRRPRNAHVNPLVARRNGDFKSASGGSDFGRERFLEPDQADRIKRRPLRGRDDCVGKREVRDGFSQHLAD
jgi:hypothetical protein